MPSARRTARRRGSRRVISASPAPRVRRSQRRSSATRDNRPRVRSPSSAITVTLCPAYPARAVKAGRRRSGSAGAASPPPRRAPERPARRPGRAPGTPWSPAPPPSPRRSPPGHAAPLHGAVAELHAGLHPAFAVRPAQVHVLHLDARHGAVRVLGEKLLARHVGQGIRVIEGQIHLAVAVAQVIGVGGEVAHQVAAVGVRQHQLDGATEAALAERRQGQLQAVTVVKDAGFRVAAAVRGPGQVHRRAVALQRIDQQGAALLDVVRLPAQQHAHRQIRQEALPC